MPPATGIVTVPIVMAEEIRDELLTADHSAPARLIPRWPSGFELILRTPPAVANDAAVRAARFESALRAICTSTDTGPWISIYQFAGGGYDGLQAIAAAALDDDQSAR